VPIVDTIIDPVVPIVDTITDPVVPIVDTVTDPVVPIVDTLIDPVAPVIDTVTDPVAPIVHTVLPPISPLGGSEDPAPVASDLAPTSPPTEPTAPADDTRPASEASADTRGDMAAPGGGSSDSPVRPQAVAPPPVTLALFTPDRVHSVDTLEDVAEPKTGAKATLDSALSSFAAAAAATVAPWLIGPSALATLELIRKTSSTAPASAAPDEMPGLPGAPSGGGVLSAPGGGASSALYALLLAFAALALLRFDRLQLRPVQWRCAAFVALLERPG
jgi:hypothetical protein